MEVKYTRRVLLAQSWSNVDCPQLTLGQVLAANIGAIQRRLIWYATFAQYWQTALIQLTRHQRLGQSCT